MQWYSQLNSILTLEICAFNCWPLSTLGCWSRNLLLFTWWRNSYNLKRYSSYIISLLHIISFLFAYFFINSFLGAQFKNSVCLDQLSQLNKPCHLRHKDILKYFFENSIRIQQLWNFTENYFMFKYERTFNLHSLMIIHGYPVLPWNLLFSMVAI